MGWLGPALSIGSGLLGLFGGNKQQKFASKYANKLSGEMSMALRAFLMGKPTGNPALDQAFNQIWAQSRMQAADLPIAEKFYKGLIPRSFSELSPAVTAQSAAATDALQSQLGSERVSELGALNRAYGGRIPASMYQAGFGNLARSGAQGMTDIARQAQRENVNLGLTGTQGMLNVAGTTPVGVRNFMGLMRDAPEAPPSQPGFFDRLTNQVLPAISRGLASWQAGRAQPTQPSPVTLGQSTRSPFWQVPLSTPQYPGQTTWKYPQQNPYAFGFGALPMS